MTDSSVVENYIRTELLLLFMKGSKWKKRKKERKKDRKIQKKAKKTFYLNSDLYVNASSDNKPFGFARQRGAGFSYCVCNKKQIKKFCFIENLPNLT